METPDQTQKLFDVTREVVEALTAAMIRLQFKGKYNALFAYHGMTGTFDLVIYPLEENADSIISETWQFTPEGPVDKTTRERRYYRKLLAKIENL